MFGFRKVIAVISLLFLISCNDETIIIEAGTPPVITPKNKAPIADFSLSAVSELIGQDVFVDESKSSDADGDALSYT